MRFLILSLVALAGLATAGEPPAEGPWSPAAESAFAAGDCALCHDLPDRTPVDRTESCTSCHVWIRAVAANPEARATAIEIFPKWERYEKTVHSYMPVPDLAAAFARLEPAWVRSYLVDPHDLRPGLPETMPRFALSEAQLDALEQLVAQSNVPVPATPKPDPANVAEGAALFAVRGCVACHGFGKLHSGPPASTAPDLVHARARMSPDRMRAWILNPQSVSPHATMANMGFDEAEATAVRDYLVLSDAAAPPAPPLGAAPAPTTEPVRWAQVEERVFGRICVHCHMDPAQNEGRAGPGNAGGFGWKATGIELQTLDGVRAVGDRIADSLLRRRAESHRDVVAWGQSPASLHRPERPGMPLGLPPLPDADIALVLGWIEQGMPE